MYNQIEILFYIVFERIIIIIIIKRIFLFLPQKRKKIYIKIDFALRRMHKNVN